MVANVVCWSVIAMLKEYIFLGLALSALAVLAALTLQEKCCTTGKPKDLESNQEEDNPLIESRGQEEIELEVKLESPTGEGSNQTGRNELTEESKESVPEHKKARRSQEGGKEKVIEADKPIEEEQVELEPTAGERTYQAEASTERKPTTEEVESKDDESLPENIKAGTSQKDEIQVKEQQLLSYFITHFCAKLVHLHYLFLL